MALRFLVPFLFLVTVGLAIAAVVARSRRGDRALSDGDREAARLPMDRDAATLRQLQKAGSDLAKPHSIEFFLYFPNEPAALEAAASLRLEGYTAEVRIGTDEGDRWLCFASLTVVPSHSTLLAVREQLERLASELGGEYDGWGAAIVR
jgi:regulator of RNase E activity RraB